MSLQGTSAGITISSYLYLVKYIVSSTTNEEEVIYISKNNVIASSGSVFIFNKAGLENSVTLPTLKYKYSYIKNSEGKICDLSKGGFIETNEIGVGFLANLKNFEYKEIFFIGIYLEMLIMDINTKVKKKIKIGWTK